MSKQALVTGGSAGIGEAVARKLAANGYQVTITGRNETSLSKLAGEIRGRYLVADMASLDDLPRIAELFAETGLDALVNNAATAHFLPIDGYTQELYETHYNTNVRGPIFLIQALLPALRQRGGAITNISSQIVQGGGPYGALYAGTKGAINAFSRSLALELAPEGIRVNVVAPGPTSTPLMHAMGDEMIEGTKAVLPLKRLAEPEEIAGVVLAQLECTNAVGTVWTVDGGMTA
ncbi:MAG: SDR family oxidoreductase [Gammaproteobacteria bacterium]|nr:SDR family oxidoreductase [Gammaproteobacteria bacterium]